MQGEKEHLQLLQSLKENPLKQDALMMEKCQAGKVTVLTDHEVHRHSHM